MKKQVAIDLIKSEIEKGTSEEAIVDMLLQDGRIGNEKVTEEKAWGLVNDVKEADDAGEADDGRALSAPLDAKTQAEAKPALPSKKPAKANGVWEEWSMRIVRDKDGNISSQDKVFKIKDVRINDEVAERLNKVVIVSGDGRTATRYFKPLQ